MLIKILVGFLAIIGGLVLLAVIALIVGYFVFAYRMRKKIRSYLDANFDRTIGFDDSSDHGNFGDENDWEFSNMEIPPMVIELVHKEGVSWSNHKEVEKVLEKASRSLTRSGFRYVGDFCVRGEDDKLKRFFMDVQGQMMAVILYSPELPEPYVEFLFEKKLGGFVQVHNYPSQVYFAPHGVLECQHIDKRISENVRIITKMLGIATKRMEQHPAKPVIDEDVPRRYERFYADEMAWRIRRGGLNRDEIVEVFKAEGLEIDEEMINKVRDKWQFAIESFLIEQSRRAAEQDDDGREVLAVHDGSNKSFLVDRLDGFLDAVSDGLDDIKDFDADRLRSELQQLLNRFSPREAISRFRAILPQPIRYSLIDQIKKPIETDLYLLPDWD